MRKLVPLAALVAAAFAAAPAQAATGDCWELMNYDGDEPVGTGQTFCQEDAWFHQNGTRLSNQPGSALPSWNTTAPTADFQSGGAVYGALRPIDIVQTYDTAARPTFAGTYTGKLTNLAVSVYNASVYSALGGGNSLYAKLTIDGKTAWENIAAEDPEIETAAEQVDEQTNVMRFAFTGLADRLALLKLANAEGTAHTIELSFINKYYGDGNFLMFYDAAEYPSGMVFNLRPDPDFGGLSGYAEVPTT